MSAAKKTRVASPRGRVALHGVDEVAAESTIAACMQEADHALDGAIAVLRSAGVLDGRAIPILLLLKLAACFRLFELEQARIAHLLQPPLPTFAEAWADFLKAPGMGHERFPGLAKNVFGAQLRHRAWGSPGGRADIVVSNLSPKQVVDELADLLFRFRHLVDEHRPRGPEEDNHG